MTTAQDQQSRAEFEAHMRKLSPCVRLYRHTCDGGDKYRTVTVQRNWELWQAARALPAGMKPFGYVRRRNGKFYHEVEGLPAADFDVVYTAAQVLTMGRVPPGFVAAPVEPTAEMVDAAEEAYMPFGDMALAIQSAVAAAPRPPAAQERKTMACACGDEFPIDSYGAGFLDAKGKCFGCDAADEAAHGIKEAD